MVLISFPHFFPEYQSRVIHLLLDMRTILNTLAGSAPWTLINQFNSWIQMMMYRHLKRNGSTLCLQWIEEKFFYIGGISVRDMISKVLCIIMSKKLMCQYNIYGQRGKVAFKNSKLCSVIVDSVKKKFRGVSVSEIEKMIEKKIA